MKVAEAEEEERKRMEILSSKQVCYGHCMLVCVMCICVCVCLALMVLACCKG